MSIGEEVKRVRWRVLVVKNNQRSNRKVTKKNILIRLLIHIHCIHTYTRIKRWKENVYHCMLYVIRRRTKKGRLLYITSVRYPCVHPEGVRNSVEVSFGSHFYVTTEDTEGHK